MLRKLMQLLAVVLVPLFAFSQTTTSGISGFVKASNGEPLVGATVVATHVPTGSTYRTTSRAGGRFDIGNMDPGGPYTVKVSFVNFEAEEKKELFLNLGESLKLDYVLFSKTENLANVTVTGTTAARKQDFGSKGGMETSIGRDKMENLPTVGRNLSDFLRAVPQAKLTSSEGGIAIAGQNNRLNSFYIDGAVNNDVFGLAASGTNGGQTGAAPISIDAIDQFQVVISPFDPSLGNFTGGGINAITRSGTNNFRGSVYYFMRNEDLTGKTPTGDKSAATKAPDFTNKTVGFRVGGPIIKNKLFYFFNGEIQRDIRPQPFEFSQYQGQTNRISALDSLRNYFTTKYNYDPGGYLDNPDELNVNRVSAKVDWNIAPKHKLSVSYRYTDAQRTNVFASNSSAINFYNNGYKFPNITHSASAELKSNFTNAIANKLLVTLTRVNDDRDPVTQDFPRVQILDGTGTGNTQGLIIGPDNSSTINNLQQRNISIFDRLTWNMGKHQLILGTDNEFNYAYNAFIQNAFGNYQYNSLADFYADARPRQYIYGFSQLDNKGDETDAAAEFNTMRLGLFAGDEWRPNDRLTLTFGARLDYYKFITDPRTDAFTNDSALPRFAAVYDLQGARSGQMGRIPVAFSPRVGFVYKIPEERVTFRGGIGLFTGRIPLVWPGGIYNNNGVSIGGYTANASQNTAALNTIRFRSDPYNQWKPQEVGISVTKGGLNLISEEFKQPKIMRASLGIDKRVGDGWTFTVEGVLTKNINEIYYTNINIKAPIGVTPNPGSRNLYPATNLPIAITSTGSNPYDNAILLTNNSGDKGFAYNFTFTIDKRFSDGWSFNANYSYGNSVVTNEATSSVNLSQWRFMEVVNGRNYIGRSFSDFDQGHRIFAYASKKFTYMQKKLATTISLVFNGQSGNPYSHVYSGAVIRDDAAGGNDLIYVPTPTELQNMVFLSNTVSGVTYTPQQQKDAFEQYITNNNYLSSRRGMFAERNGDRLPFTKVLDLKVAQDVNIKMGKNRYQFQITYDVFNFSNMINRSWGRTYFLSNDQYATVSFAGYTTLNGVANTPQYRFNPQNLTRTPWNISTSLVPNYAARWVSQLGVRFNIN